MSSGDSIEGVQTLEYIKFARRLEQKIDQTSPSLSYHRPPSLFLSQTHSFLLLYNQRSFSLSTVLHSVIDWEEQPLISLSTALPSILDLVKLLLISLSTALLSVYL